MKRSLPFSVRQVTLVLYLAVPLLAMAQTYVNKEWSETTGLPDTLNWNASVFDVQGNVLMTGNTLAGPGNPDMLINKYDREGGLVWQRGFDGTAHGPDYGGAIASDYSGNVFVAGATTSSSGLQDITVLKYSTDGDLIWHRGGSKNLLTT